MSKEQPLRKKADRLIGIALQAIAPNEPLTVKNFLPAEPGRFDLDDRGVWVRRP